MRSTLLENNKVFVVDKVIFCKVLNFLLFASFQLYGMENIRPTTKLSKKLHKNVQEKIKDYTHAHNVTGIGQTCLIIDDGEHLKMVKKVIGCIAPMANLGDLNPNDSYNQILTYIQKTAEKTKKPVIVNFSGDFITECKFLVPNNDFFNDLSFWINENDQGALFQAQERLKNSNKIYFLNKLTQLSQQPKMQFIENTNYALKNAWKEGIEQLKSDIQIAELKEKVSFIERTKKDFYQKVAQSPGLFVFSMGNRWATRNNIINRIFSPLRANFDKEDFVNNAIFVVNITDDNIVEENSETPNNDGRGDFPIGRGWKTVKDYSNGTIQNNPLQPLDNTQLRRLQEATLSVKGQWDENSGVHGTSAAAATLSGFLVLLRQKFPQLTKNQLREAVLYSAIKTFYIPTEALEPNPAQERFRKGKLEDGKYKINGPWGYSSIQASSFYGQGLFDAKRALKYAEELLKISGNKIDG